MKCALAILLWLSVGLSIGAGIHQTRPGGYSMAADLIYGTIIGPPLLLGKAAYEATLWAFPPLPADPGARR